MTNRYCIECDEPAACLLAQPIKASPDVLCAAHGQQRAAELTAKLEPHTLTTIPLEAPPSELELTQRELADLRELTDGKPDAALNRARAETRDALDDLKAARAALAELQTRNETLRTKHDTLGKRFEDAELKAAQENAALRQEVDRLTKQLGELEKVDGPPPTPRDPA